MAEVVPAAPVPAPPVPPAQPTDAPAAPPAAPPPGTHKPLQESRVAAEAARKERAVQADKAAWKKQRDTEQAAWTERLAKAEAVEAKLAAAKADPRKAMEALEALGVDYDTLTKVKLGDDPAALAVRTLEKKLADIEAAGVKKDAEAKVAAEAAAKAAENRTLSDWHARTADYVSKQGEKYELVNALGYQAEVGKMIEEHFEATGEEVTAEAAAAKLEAHLQAEQEPAVAAVFKKLTATKWFKSRFAPVAQASETPAAPPKRARDQDVPEKKIIESAAPTITNKMVASSQNKTPAAKTREELRAKALLSL